MITSPAMIGWGRERDKRAHHFQGISHLADPRSAAVAPADRGTPGRHVTNWAAMRHVDQCGENPVNASTPMLPSDAKPDCDQRAAGQRDKVTMATVPSTTAIAPVPA